MGRRKGQHPPHKHPSHDTESQSNRHPLETDQSQHYLELPDPETHILIADEEDLLPGRGDNSESSYRNIACRPAEGKVRHWSEDQPRTGESGRISKDQYISLFLYCICVNTNTIQKRPRHMPSVRVDSGSLRSELAHHVKFMTIEM